MTSQARKANVNLDLTNKTAVIAGGSQGIGAGIAIRFANAGANIIIIGRSQSRLESVAASARAVAKSPTQKVEYIVADLGLVSGTKQAAKEIEAKAPGGKVEYLIQTQGGMPNGLFTTTSEGIENHFAVQVLNRFLLAYILSSSGVLTDTCISIMAPGGSQTAFDLEDVELTTSKDAGRYTLMGKQIARDSVVTDCYTKALQTNFPKTKFFHVSPGLVQTDVMVNQGVPFPIQQLITYVVYPIAARTFGNTVTSYADVPVFLAANEVRDEVIAKEGFFLSNGIKKISLSPFAMDVTNQSKVFEKLKGYLDGR